MSDPDGAAGGHAQSTTEDTSGALDLSPPGRLACPRQFVRPKPPHTCEQIAELLNSQYPGTDPLPTILSVIDPDLCLIHFSTDAPPEELAALAALADVAPDCPVVFPASDSIAGACDVAVSMTETTSRDLMSADFSPDTPAPGDPAGVLYILDGAQFNCRGAPQCWAKFAALKAGFQESAHIRYTLKGALEGAGADSAAIDIRFRQALTHPATGIGSKGRIGDLVLALQQIVLDLDMLDVPAVVVLPLGYTAGDREEGESLPHEAVLAALNLLESRAVVVAAAGNKNMHACDTNTKLVLPAGSACAGDGDDECVNMLVVGALGQTGRLSTSTRNGGVAQLFAPGFTVVGDDVTCRVGEGSSIACARAGGLATRLLLRGAMGAAQVGRLLYTTGVPVKDLEATPADVGVPGVAPGVPKRVRACEALNTTEGDQSIDPRKCDGKAGDTGSVTGATDALVSALRTRRNLSLRSGCSPWLSNLAPGSVGTDPPTSECEFDVECPVGPLPPPHLCPPCVAKIDPGAPEAVQVLLEGFDIDGLDEHTNTASCHVEVELADGGFSRTDIDLEQIASYGGRWIELRFAGRRVKAVSLVCDVGSTRNRGTLPLIEGASLTGEDAAPPFNPICDHELKEDLTKACDDLLHVILRRDCLDSVARRLAASIKQTTGTRIYQPLRTLGELGPPQPPPLAP